MRDLQKGVIVKLLKKVFIEKPPKPHPRHLNETDAYYRVSMLWRLMSGFATIVHMIYLLLFLHADIHEMVIYNCGSLLFWIIVIILIKKGVFYTAFILSMSEALVHGFLATYFTGIESGFFLLMIAVPIVGFINPPQINIFNFFMKTLFLISPIFLLIYIWRYTIIYGAVYNLSYRTIELMFILNITIALIYISSIGGFFSYLVMIAERKLAKEFLRSESLLLNILPKSIALRLKNHSETIADHFSDVTVLFLDIVDFTQISSGKDPSEIVNILNGLFSRFDSLADKYQMEKIKTIGDAYMLVAGIPESNKDHACVSVKMAFSMLDEISQFNKENSTDLNARIGICSGEVVAGVIGKKKFIYDLWGDTVNTASRMESHGQPGRIQITKSTWDLVNTYYTAISEQEVEIKGKGIMRTWLL